MLFHMKKLWQIKCITNIGTISSQHSKLETSSSKIGMLRYLVRNCRKIGNYITIYEYKWLNYVTIDECIMDFYKGEVGKYPEFI